MEAKAIAKSQRISPLKGRLVANLIRGKKIGDALAILQNTAGTVKESILKVVNSAVANAEHLSEINNENLDIEDLFIKDITINPGAVLKRYRARAKGSGNRILKRTSHISVVVATE